MTCILGYSNTGIDTTTGMPTNMDLDPLLKSVLLKADSRVSYADYGFMLKQPKIFIRDDIMFGYAGVLKDAQLFQHTYYELVRPEDVSDIAYIHNVLNEIIPASMQSKVVSKASRRGMEDMDVMPTSNLNLLVGYRGNLYHVDSFLCVTLLAEPFQATGSGQPTALGAYALARRLGLLDAHDPDEETTMPSVDGEELLDIVMDSVCDIHMGVAGPFCMVEQVYNTQTEETIYVVKETYSEVDTIFTKPFPHKLSIIYDTDDQFVQYGKVHIPETEEKVLPKKSKKAKPKKSSTTTKKKRGSD
jgi:hypothetical protein